MPRAEAAEVTSIARDPWDFPPVEASTEYKGIKYKFRELTVAEVDQCRDDATINGEWDGRLMTRFMIVAAAVEPPMTLEQLGKMPQRLYSAVVTLVNDLNDPDSEEPDPND